MSRSQGFRFGNGNYRLTTTTNVTSVNFFWPIPSRGTMLAPSGATRLHPQGKGGPAAAEERLALAGTGSAFRTQNWVLVWPYTGGRLFAQSVLLFSAQ